jgi:DNA polymerase-3 subunit beta
MELKVQKKEFLRVLSKCASVAERKGPMPMLSNVLITTTGGDSVVLAATDLALSVRGSVPAQVGQFGTWCVNAKDLLDRVSTMPDGVEVSITIKDNSCEVKAAKRKFMLPVIPGAEFPELPEPNEKCSSFEIEARVLSHLIAQTQYAISPDISREFLTSALFDRKDGELTVVATDGHRLAFSSITGEDLKKGDKLMVSSKGVQELRRLCSIDDEKVKVHYSPANAFFDVGGFQFTVKIATAQFPPYEQVIPSNLPRVAVVDRAELMAAVKAVSLSASERTGGLKLVLGGGQLRVETSSEDSGTGSDELECECEGKTVEIGVSARYLLDALGCVTTEKATLRFGDSLDPVRVEEHAGPQDSKFIGVVMPMRL